MSANSESAPPKAKAGKAEGKQAAADTAADAVADAPGPQAASPESSSPEAPSQEPPPADPAAELADAQDRYMRLYAEFENYKKRTGRENEEFKKYANESLLRELLNVLDNLDRAMEHAQAARDSDAEETGKLLEGVEMTRKQFFEVLEKFGVKSIPAQGEPFDPAMHQAVSQVETDETTDGNVHEEFRKGYFFKERVLRPAMVVVARKKA